jgi:hypothetical protein
MTSARAKQIAGALVLALAAYLVLVFVWLFA